MGMFMSLLSHGYNSLRSTAGALRNRARLAFDHVRTSERGAQTAEYCAILLVVAGMVAALIGVGLPGRVAAGITSAVDQLGLPAAAEAPLIAPGAEPPAAAPPIAPGAEPPADAPADAQEEEN
jgi:hypothetical protein